MWRRRVGAVVILTAMSACGGGDGDEERTIAFVRTTAIAPESHDAFVAELAAAGWKVGENLTLLNEDPLSGVEDQDQAAALVEGFVEDGADIIVALSTTAALGAVEVAGDIPILTLTSDPVATGLVDDPREPGGTVTGVAFRVPADRTIDVARQLVGADASVGFLYPSEDPGAAPVADAMAEAADALEITLLRETWSDDGDAGAAVARLAENGAEIVILANSPTSVRAFPAVEAAARAAGVPVVANTNVAEFAVVVLAPEGLGAYQQLARQADRLLEGNEVAEVPVEDPGSFHLLVRRGIAESLGFTIPDELLAQADEVEG